MSADPGSGTPMSERMQALLSRAVEDQLTEQRQVAGVLAEVRGYLAHVASELEALRTNPPGGVDEVERQVAAVGADVREAIRVLGDRIDGVSGQVHQRGNDLAELRSAVDGVTGLVQQRGNDLAELRSAVDGDLSQRIEAVDNALRDLRGAFTGIASRVADLPGRGDVEGMVARVGDPATELAQRIDRVEGWLEEVHAGLFGEDGIQAQLQELAAPPESDEDEDIEEVDVVEAVEDAVGRAVAESETRVSAQLNDAVAEAIADSEQRVAAHVDEAVLALAEALLRKRRNPLAAGGITPGMFDTGPIPVVPADVVPAEQSTVDLGSHENDPVAEAQYEEAGYDEPQYVEPPYEEARYSGEQPAASLESYDDAYQPANVGGGQVDLGEDYADDDELARRRRPWWRPGD